MRAALQLGLALACALVAQETGKPLLQNTGKPMLVDYSCTAEDIQWAGLGCTDDEPCPIYLELSGVESVGNKIFTAGNIHSGSGTLYSVVLASDDSGKTWREVHDRVRGGTLDHFQFIDFETGWISGQVVYPLPQDPFFLVTSDGGKTWRRRPVFAETRSGSILQFWFSSRANGSMVIDRGQAGDLGRYELYESPNGGETWMLREANERQLRIKRAAAAPVDWRIRADGATKAHVLERRQGERWVAMAAFAVAMRPCKPPPPPEPEAVPEPTVEEQPPAPETPPARPRTPPTLKRNPR